MVKKVATLGSVKDLNLSSPTQASLLKNFRSLDDAIKEGRVLAYSQDRSPRPLKKWEAEFVSCLRNEGFIHETNDLTLAFNVARLYKRVYTLIRDDCFVTGIHGISNSWYEKFRPLSFSDMHSLKLSLSSNLSAQHYRAVCLRYGLVGQEAQSFAEIAHDLGCSINMAIDMEHGALIRLRHAMIMGESGDKIILPPILEAPGWIEEAVENIEKDITLLHADPIFKKEEELFDALRKLHEDPIFKKERDLRYDLERYTKETPWRFRHEECDYDAPKSQNLKDLGLSTYIVTALSRVRVSDVRGLLELSRAYLFKIDRIGAKAIEELTEMMHDLGYTDWPRPNDD